MCVEADEEASRVPGVRSGDEGHHVALAELAVAVELAEVDRV
jgi:hypothetical protein